MRVKSVSISLGLFPIVVQKDTYIGGVSLS